MGKSSFYDEKIDKVVNPLFYGVKNVYMISHGEWADPEIKYKNYLFNYYDLEDTLNEQYEEDKQAGNIDKSISFEDYIKDNQDSIYEMLDNAIIEKEKFRDEEIYGKFDKEKLQKAMDQILSIEENAKENDCERDGEWFPKKVVELVEGNTAFLPDKFNDFSTADEIKLIEEHSKLEDAVNSLFNDYSEEDAITLGKVFTDCLNKIEKELENEESEER